MVLMITQDTLVQDQIFSLQTDLPEVSWKARCFRRNLMILEAYPPHRYGETRKRTLHPSSCFGFLAAHSAKCTCLYSSTYYSHHYSKISRPISQRGGSPYQGGLKKASWTRYQIQHLLLRRHDNHWGRDVSIHFGCRCGGSLLPQVRPRFISSLGVRRDQALADCQSRRSSSDDV